MCGYSIEGSGTHYYIMKNGAEVMGPFGSHGRAQDVRDELIRKERMRERPCITCGIKFMSEGPHNRMCDDCRAKASNMGLLA